ncbi:MAG: cytochrome P450 [Actinomycetota bacterium]
MLNLVRRQNDGSVATDVILDIGLAALEADPYPTYVWMRRELPIAFVPETGRVLVTTWALCEEAGSNDEVFGPTQHPFNTVYGDPNVMSLTGPAHRNLRNSLNPPFRPRAVTAYRDSALRATAARYVEGIRTRGGAEVCGELLEPISQRAVGDVLGFSDVDDDTIGRWFRAYAAYLVDFGRDAEVAEHGRAVKDDVRAYLQGRLPVLLDRPDDGALSHMLRDGMPEGETRSVEELIGSVGVMIVGGIQEPAHAAANALLGLLGRPEQAARLAADPATWSPKAVEEGLRWLSPFGMTEKRTTTDTMLGGLLFRAGTEVSLVIGSANRDPDRFVDPDVFDLDRERQGHQSFGYGVHFCIGHFVARVLAQVMIEEMFTRLPNLRPDPDREPLVHGWANRAALQLPLVWDA